MCGIAGMIDWHDNLENHAETFAAMQATLLRRGPDQNGIFIQNPVALIHTRLSVVDLEHGRQPMHLTHGGQEYILVYNGELYNTPELRRELMGLGHTFAGTSDTEVLLHAFARWGDDCVSRLNGIFAFAVWDTGARRLFCARDRFGVKPFFFARRGESFLFASELKALLAHPLVEPVIDTGSVAELLLMGPGRTPGCGVFRGVEELPPASCLALTEDGVRQWTYWQLRDREHRDSFAATAETVRALTLDAIRRQLVSDVPVCTLLSGGLDSSIISAVADRVLGDRGEQLHTFSVDYEGNDRYFQKSRFQPDSDVTYIEMMNAFLHARHHRVLLAQDDVADALTEAAEARDLPGMADVDSSLLLFCREIKKHATVALSGECADEIFGGYPWYRDKAIRDRDGFPWAQSTAYRAGFLAAPFAGRIDAFAYVDARYRDTLARCDILPGQDPDTHRLKEMVNLNMTWFMQTLLDRKDRMSMHGGLEVRVPFCDHRIAEYLYGVPWEMKEYRGQEKGLLREAMRGILPEGVLWRKKSPYPKTHHPRYLELVSGMLRRVLDDKGAPLLQIVDRAALEALLRADNPVPWYGQLMTTPQTIAYFVQLNHWMEHYNVRVVE